MLSNHQLGSDSSPRKRGYKAVCPDVQAVVLLTFKPGLPLKKCICPQIPGSGVQAGAQ